MTCNICLFSQGPLSREIVETQVTSKAGLDALYSKLVTTVVLRSGLGNPTSGKVLREATAALQSSKSLKKMLKSQYFWKNMFVAAITI